MNPVLFTVEGCARCRIVKKHLDDREIQYSTSDLSLSEDEVAECAFQDIGPFQRPLVRTGDGRFLDYERIMEWLAR